MIRMLADAYLVILVPLISPIAALPESLTVYRIHGSNSYYAAEQKISPEARALRGMQIQTLIRAMFEWLDKNKLLESQNYAKVFRNRWDLLFKSLQFENEPPGRWGSFLFLLRQNFTFSRTQTWKFTALKCISACLALLVGYRKAQVWGDGILGGAQHVLGKLSRGRFQRASMIF